MVILLSATKIIHFVLNGLLTEEKKNMTKGLRIIMNCNYECMVAHDHRIEDNYELTKKRTQEPQVEYLKQAIIRRREN